MTKRALLVFSTLLLSVCGFSQIERHDLFSTGSVGLSFSTNNTIESDPDSLAAPSTLNLSLNPRLGWFVGRKLALGLGISYNLQVTTREVRIGEDLFREQKDKRSSFTVGPFMRYHLLIAEKISPYLQLETSYGRLTLSTVTKTDQGDIVAKADPEDVLGVSIGGGCAIFLNEHVAIDGSVHYLWQTVTSDGLGSVNSTQYNNIFVNIGFFIRLGVLEKTK